MAGSVEGRHTGELGSGVGSGGDDEHGGGGLGDGGPGVEEKLDSGVGGPGELDGGLNGVLAGVLAGALAGGLDSALDGIPDGGRNGGLISEHQTPRQEGSRLNLNSRFGLESGWSGARVRVGFESGSGSNGARVHVVLGCLRMTRG
jgi:hypothetical protein